MRYSLLIGLFCVGLFLNGVADAQSPGGVARIGILNDQSGPYADFGGRTSADAARMAIEDAGGKVLGKSIEIIIGDHQNKPDVASAIARRWFDVDGVSAIAELTNSAVALAVQQIARPEIETAFARLAQEGAVAAAVAQDATLFAVNRDHLVAVAAKHSVPTIYWQEEFATAGGLASYGPNFADAYRQAGIYAGRVLKGEKPADLPVVQPTKFKFVINLKTAKALGIKISDNMLSVADEVIE